MIFDQTPQPDSSTDFFTVFKNTKKFIFTLLMVVGFLILFFYSYVEIHFFPSGLSIGDSLLFIFIALGFGFIVFIYNFFVFYLIWPLYECLAYLSRKSKIIEKKNLRKKPFSKKNKKSLLNYKVVFFIALAMTVCYLIITYESSLGHKENDTQPIILIITCILLTPLAYQGIKKSPVAKGDKLKTTMYSIYWSVSIYIYLYIIIINHYEKNQNFYTGLFILFSSLLINLLLLIMLSLFTKSINDETSKYPYIYLLALILFLSLLFAATGISLLANKNISQIVFEKTGIRHKNASLVLSIEAEEKINSLWEIKKLMPNDCQHQTETSCLDKISTGKYAILKNVTILWHGIGDKSLIQLKLPNIIAYEDKSIIKTDDIQDKAYKYINLELNNDEITLVK